MSQKMTQQEGQAAIVKLLRDALLDAEDVSDEINTAPGLSNACKMIYAARKLVDEYELFGEQGREGR